MRTTSFVEKIPVESLGLGKVGVVGLEGEVGAGVRVGRLGKKLTLQGSTLTRIGVIGGRILFYPKKIHKPHWWSNSHLQRGFFHFGIVLQIFKCKDFEKNLYGK